ncbi:tryptophan-rich antigen (Pv-fam-a) [Plasmodium ovale wallikeri]|uniref:Tryptophan-rich antigen (Pv-fam-a) n=2 Tax=Plasmodium ovale TaxID=36330 RepID=A0A1A8YYN0_PLAOA|nr:tryptophan-rich antigen (Pv-fam-a) [Plasmodium ovale wallikeri]SBT57251.1 tryptophan-rich antigen (Pv-fam-a) [Plasmodium ovale wallikeri]SBT73904.1 tryptophan-rich protein [Plasmodium ovale]
MELRKSVKNILSLFSSSTSVTTKKRNNTLMNVNMKSLVSYLPMAILVVLFTLILNPSYASINEETNKRDDSVPDNLMEFWKGAVEETEVLKNYAWNNWMMRLEADWEQYNNSMKEKKKVWLNEAENEWTKFMNSMENKWTINFKENMDEELKSPAISKSSTWNENEWKEWIQTEGKKIMDADLQKWIKEKETSLDLIIIAEWVYWKNNKIMTWLLSDWKNEEDNYWAQWENMKWSKWFKMEDRKHWLKWKERIAKESEQWTNWLNLKENVYIFSEWNRWSEWKNEKTNMFNKWADSFINKWINEKKWKTLFNKENDSISQP